MDTAILLKGLLIGFSIAAPVGPIGILCVRRSLADGRLSGFVSGLGAATADAVYGSVAAFGLTWLSSFLIDQQMWIRLVGGAFLCYLGVTTFFAKVAEKPAETHNGSLLAAYASTFFLTLTNPLTILSFAAIFAGIGIASAGQDYLGAAVMVLGVFLGSALWWFFLSEGVSLLHGKFTPAGFRWINRISGMIIAGFGILALLSL
ncbi:MAG: LysE family transporter [Chloroflexi bacterium]|nr:LysE family transporter [Chloroflexota bacterium]